jgi:hypothetical protein
MSAAMRKSPTGTRPINGDIYAAIDTRLAFGSKPIRADRMGQS